MRTTDTVKIMSVSLFTGLLMSLCIANPAQCDNFPTGIPFRYVAGHILLLPVTVGDKETCFVLDTGAGVNVISESLATKLGFNGAGKVTGQRMSGQKVSMKLVTVPSLQVGTCRQRSLPMATWKLEDAFVGAPDLAHVDGLISLEFFRKFPFTIDYSQQKLFIENEAGLQNRLGTGTAVPIQVTVKHAQTSIYLLMWLSNGNFVKAEVDTGSGALILDTKYMREFKIDPGVPDVKTVKGLDETGNPYVRYFTKLPGDIFLAQNRNFTQQKPAVQFQKIIYDGLVGDEFLKNFVVTFDLPHKRMIFNMPKKKMY